MLQAMLLPFCVVLFFAFVALKLKLGPPDTRKRSVKERVKYLRILAVGCWL